MMGLTNTLSLRFTEKSKDHKKRNTSSLSTERDQARRHYEAFTSASK